MEDILDILGIEEDNRQDYIKEFDKDLQMILNITKDMDIDDLVILSDMDEDYNDDVEFEYYTKVGIFTIGFLL